ncbi:MAG TPA: ABC transporter substrate-binding protein [Tissierellia bacterium]|jgi:branched-chain amino acid transport system substrate-binding protein|nr:ABC transporter substrate-binding protein [Tissierellia bacterium]
MKKLLSVFLVLVLMAAALVGCSKAPSQPAASGADAEEIKIGINYELSGGVAAYGQANLEGIELAVEQINAAGGVDGKMIKLVTYDNKSDHAEATTLANRMMTQDGVLAAIGPATSGAFKATIPVAEKNEVPVVSGSATADDVTVDDKGLKEYAFRICFNDSYQGTAMADFAMNTLGAKNAVIIMDSSSDYGKGLAKNFKEQFERNGGKVVAEESYVEKDTEFNAILTKIKGEDFDVIFIPGYYEEAGLIIKQARAQGIDTPILGADGFDSPDLLELAGADALNDVYFSNHYSSLDQDPVVLKFIEDFKAKYGKDPNAFHALGYDAMKFVADAVGRAANLDGPSVKDALASTENFVGVTGSFSIDENHNPVKSIVVIGLKDGVQDSITRSGE